MTLKLLASHRFIKAYRKSMPNLQYMAEQKVRYFIHLQRSEPRTVIHKYDKIESIRERLIEIDFSAQHRIAAEHRSGELRLLAIGGHDVIPRYSNAQYENDISTLAPAPAGFTNEVSRGFFSCHSDPFTKVHFQLENTAEWLFFLDDPQSEMHDSILEEIVYEEFCCAVLIGGPGTGKTCILLNLLKFFADLERSVRLAISEELREMIERSFGVDLSRFIRHRYSKEPTEILLCDDPSRREIENLLEQKDRGIIDSLVLAFDPLQLDEVFTDEEFGKLVHSHHLKRFELTSCYRQKHRIGLTAKSIMDKVAESSPYAKIGRVTQFKNARRKLTEISNDSDFVNPGGHVESYDNCTEADVQVEVDRIRGLPKWKHAPGLLILMDNFDLSSETKKLIEPFMRMNYCIILPLSSVDQIKGLEFQHVFIFIAKSLFDKLRSEFTGSGPKLYEEFRRLRIPFSRAKDSLVLFVVNDKE